VKIGDKKIKSSVMRGLTKLMINMALAGDKRALAELMRQINRYFPEPPETEDTSLPFAEEDQKILENYIRRRLGDDMQSEKDGAGAEEF